jgi:hypothetical protein
MSGHLSKRKFSNIFFPRDKSKSDRFVIVAMFTLSEKKSKEFTEEESHRSVIFSFLCYKRICSLRNWRVLSVEGFVR